MTVSVWTSPAFDALADAMVASNCVLIGSLAVAFGWLGIGLLGLLRLHSVRFVGHVLFPLGALGGLVLSGLAFLAIGEPAATLTLPIGLPDLPFHMRLDALSAFFLLLLGVTSAGISVFAAGYFREGQGTAPGLLCLQYHIFLASMALVLLADDAYSFMVAWETMALSSYFLVTARHGIPEIRRAGLIYLLLAHVGAIGILLCFGILQGGNWQFTFDAMRHAQLTPFWATVAFGLAVFGFGTKAGLVPLHVWLPEAHPAAPSPVSALMSGVMLKTAIYGLLRVAFDLMGVTLWWWGLCLLALGLFTGLFGIVFAAVQTDMKRLLAYSSIENIGIIFAGLGLAILFHAFGMQVLAALALAATLYHCLNHAFFKSLLFLATGSVLHATKQRNLGKLGGLIRRMPWVAWLALIGALAIAGLPPLNGFVSEWLLLQAFLFTPEIPQNYVNMLVPLGAAVLVLVAALAGYVMVKFYGVIFLGQMREPQLAQAKDCGLLERLGLLWLAAGCVLLGLAPPFVLGVLDHINFQLLGAMVGNHGGGAWWFAPTSPQRASYSPVMFLVGIMLAVALVFYGIRRAYHGRLRRAAAWNCGYPLRNARMQDTAEGFGQPIRQIFEPFFRMQRELPSPFDTAPRYRVVAEDWFWHGLYLPASVVVQKAANVMGRLQQGRVAVYLLYSFLTLVILLLVVL
jgi:formate hydrogenlyase subunit 3/multisubunit Na+/H+ antiporter MnhD subunit